MKFQPMESEDSIDSIENGVAWEVLPQVLSTSLVRRNPVKWRFIGKVSKSGGFGPKVVSLEPKLINLIF